MRSAAVLGVVVLSSACAAPAVRRPGLEGNTAEQVLRCAGVPQATSKFAGKTLWTYTSKTGCSGTVEFSGDAVDVVTFDPPGGCPAIFGACGPAAAPRSAEPAPRIGDCPQGWSSKGGAPCYPDKAFFGGSKP